MDSSSIGQTSPIFSRPLPGQLAHWEGYLNKVKWPKEYVVDRLTPFYGKTIFQNLSEVEKHRLYWGFIQINAEIIIHLEQTLLLAHQGFNCKSFETKNGLDEFIQDELLHIDLFRNYLHTTPEISFPERPLFLHRDLNVRRWCYWLYRFEPLAPFLPAAKSEMYAVQYYYAIRPHLPKIPTRWLELVKFHAQDEASHIRVDFAILDEQLKGMGPFGLLRLMIGTFGAVILTQLCLAVSAWQLMNVVFFKQGFFKRLFYFFHMVHWTLAEFDGFTATRRLFSAKLRQQKHFFYRVFTFMGW